MNPLTPFGIVVALAGLAAFPYFVGSALWWPWARRRARPGQPSPSGALAIVHLLAAAALFVVPRIAGTWAENATGWVDLDDDGMLDPMANGGYDWVDINGGAFFRYAGLLCFAILLVVGTAHYKVREG